MSTEKTEHEEPVVEEEEEEEDEQEEREEEEEEEEEQPEEEQEEDTTISENAPSRRSHNAHGHGHGHSHGHGHGHGHSHGHHNDEATSLDMVGALSTEREERRREEAARKFQDLLATKNRDIHREISPIDLHSNTQELHLNEAGRLPYTVLLHRVYEELEAKNPDFHKGKMQRKLPPPNTAYIGSKKTGWNNFAETCKEMNRNVEHVRSFFLTEMNTDGNLNADNNLILKGRWKSQQMQSILTKYIKEYVRCSNCRSPETSMSKDASTRLYFLSCNVCHAKRSVEPIKAGFHAKMKGERRAERAAK